MGCPIGPNSLFGANNNYIKFQQGNIVALNGPNTVETMILSDLQIPYKQVSKAKIMLKPGQVNYLLSNAGIGSNATFLALVARYDPQSVFEEDNYIQFNYSTDLSRSYYFDQIMILTGNSVYRVPQLYITNPNATYSVSIDAMFAVIDDAYSIFNDTINQSGMSLTGLFYTSINTYIPNQSIVIYDSNSPRNALAYITLADINSIQKSGRIVIVDNRSLGRIFLEFSTQYDADQAFSLLNYVLDNPGVIIQNLNPIADSTPPYVFLNLTAGVGGATISIFTQSGTYSGTASAPYNTTDADQFITNISLGTYGTNSVITYSNLINLLINRVVDNRDGLIFITNSNISVFQSTTSSGLVSVSSIVGTGSYAVEFVLSDLAQNFVPNTKIINLTITS